MAKHAEPTQCNHPACNKYTWNTYCAEHEHANKHAMLIRADARAMGIVTSTTTRVSDRWTPTRTKAGECESIFPDGTRIPFIRSNSKSRATRKNPHTVTIDRAAQNARLRNIAGTIRMGEQD